MGVEFDDYCEDGMGFDEVVRSWGMPNKKLLDPSRRVFGICGSATEGVIGKVKEKLEEGGLR